MNFDNCLQNQIKHHPSMQLQDLVKMCYQAVFGPEHMLADIERAKNYFMQEYEATPADSSVPLYEPVSDVFCRVNLPAWKAKGFDADKLFELFFSSAKNAPSGREDDFNCCVEVVENCILKGLLPYSLAEWQEYYSTYKKDGIRPVHHSDVYRLAERPAYRLVCNSLLKAVLPE